MVGGYWVSWIPSYRYQHVAKNDFFECIQSVSQPPGIESHQYRSAHLGVSNLGVTNLGVANLGVANLGVSQFRSLPV